MSKHQIEKSSSQHLAPQRDAGNHQRADTNARSSASRDKTETVPTPDPSQDGPQSHSPSDRAVPTAHRDVQDVRDDNGPKDTSPARELNSDGDQACAAFEATADADISSTVSQDRLSGDENIPLLLLLLFPAGLRRAIAAIPQKIRFKMIAFFGVCSMIAPLALWIAPSMKVWLSILAASLLSILFCWALVWFGPEDHY